jgi:hypothetical protein
MSKLRKVARGHPVYMAHRYHAKVLGQQSPAYTHHFGQPFFIRNFRPARRSEG